jgi:hypothetical protein
MGKILALALEPTKGNLDQFCRWQNLPDTNRILASSLANRRIKKSPKVSLTWMLFCIGNDNLNTSKRIAELMITKLNGVRLEKKMIS